MKPVVLTDARQHSLVRLTDGQTNTMFGGPGTGPGQFQNPMGVARYGPTGLLIADRGNNRIVAIDDMAGANWRTLGSGGSGELQFQGPCGVAVGDDGAIWIADSGNRRIVRIADISGDGWTAFGAAGRPTPTDPAVGMFWDPVGISVAAADQILIADPGAGRIVVISDSAGAGWRSSALGALSTPTSVCRYGDGFAVADFKAGRVAVLDAGLAVSRASSDMRLTGVGVVRPDGESLVALVPPLLALDALSDDGADVMVETELRLGPLGVHRPVGMEVLA